LKETNTQKVFDFLAAHPDRSLVAIAGATGLSKQQVTSAVNALANEGAIPPKSKQRLYRLADGAKRPEDKRGGPRVPKSKRLDVANISVSRGTE
jgi:hypothetical protein